MSIPQCPSQSRFGWLTFPLLIFAASRAMLLAFAASAPFFGGRLGGDGGALAAYPVWSRLAHGDIAGYARVAGAGYVGAADVAIFPLAPWLGKGLGVLLGSVELGLALLSLVACAAAFCGVYRLLDLLRGRDAARWGLGLLVAFPFAYHLSDGSALGLALALSAWGVVLALRARFGWSAGVLSLAVLAHPMAVFSVLAAATLGPAERGWRRGAKWVAVALATLVGIAWTATMASRLHLGGAALFRALMPSAPSSHVAWAMLLGFGGLLAGGVVVLSRQPGLRGLAVLGAIELALAALAWTSAAAIALVLCWPAFLGLGQILARRPGWRAPLVAMLGAHQGLLFYCFTQFLHQT